MSEYKHEQVRSRNEPFAQRTATQIWYEEPSPENPYVAQSALCHGYDLFELMEKRSFVDVFFLLFRGELPSPSDSALLQTLMIALINPGPRHAATRAAMNVGVGKTDPMHILPVAAAVLGGNYAGGGEVERAMIFIEQHKDKDPRECAAQIVTDFAEKNADAINVVSETGFGVRDGSIDIMAEQIAHRLLKLEGAGTALKWAGEVASHLKTHKLSFLTTGVAAAALIDLGFQARAGGCLFQLLGAPGLVAHGLEMASKPILAMPFVSDENYVIER